MTLLYPEWLFLLPLLAVLGWKFRGLGLHFPLRALFLLLLAAALTAPVLIRSGKGIDLWLLIDRSDSTAGQTYAQSRELQQILEKSKEPEDRLFIVDYAKDAIRRDQGDPVFRGTNASNLSGALDFTLALSDPARNTRFLVLTDGYSTEPLERTGEKLLRARIPLDYRLASTGKEDDLRIANVKLPPRVRPGEPFLLEFAIVGAPADNRTIPWEISRKGSPPLKGSATLHRGRALVRTTDRLAAPGAVSYRMSLTAPDDPIPQNNTATSWVEATGGSGVLLLSAYPNDPMKPFLKALGLQIKTPANPAAVSPEDLTGCRLVILNNVGASSLHPRFLESLNFFVKEQGGSLLMCGGKNSFGSGGYFSSPVDNLLPVSMELRKEHKKLMVAMSVVLDRSGSMTASAGGGKTKMDMANEGTARAIEQLGDNDFISVIAVDSSPHTIITQSRVGDQREALLRSVRRIGSQGGGIFIEEGLKAGWEQLKKIDVGTRHMLLFADACDSEEPGDYKDILREMTDAGATVSVIGMGRDTDCDAALLKEIAALGQGRIFFNDNPGDLPSIFTQETVSIARSAFITDKTGTASTPGWLQIASRSPKWPAAIDGYNLSYLKEGASCAVLSEDEYKAPLVAFWSRGAGRAAALSFPVAGKYADSVLQWPEYGDFIQTLSRWLIGKDTPSGYSVRTAIKGEQLDVDLLYSDEHIADIAQSAPQAVIECVSADGEARSLPGVWEQIRPGLLRTSFRPEHGDFIRGAIRLGDLSLPFGPASLASEAEWAFDNERKKELLDLCAESGGTERIQVSDIWKAPRTVTPRELRPWLLWGALGTFLLEALLTRLGFTLLPRKKAKKAEA